MKKHNKPPYLYIITIMLLFFNGIMLIFPKEITEGAKNGLLLWYNHVLPALLPFMVSSRMLVGCGLAEQLARPGAFVMARLFNLPGAGALAMVMGLISGCPMGAATACDIYKRGLINREQAQRLAVLSNNTGLIFMVASLGQGLLHSKAMGYRLLLVIHMAAWLVGMAWGRLLPPCSNTGGGLTATEAFNPFKLFTEAVMQAIKGVTAVGCYIMLFSVICTCLDVFNLGSGLVFGLLEVTRGVKELSPTGNIPLIAGVAAWAGLSIHCQSAALLSEAGIPVRGYIIGKAGVGAVAFGLGFLVYKYLKM